VGDLNGSNRNDNWSNFAITGILSVAGTKKKEKCRKCWLSLIHLRIDVTDSNLSNSNTRESEEEINPVNANINVWVSTF